MYYATNRKYKIFVCSDKLGPVLDWVKRSEGIFVDFQSIPADLINEDKLTYII